MKENIITKNFVLLFIFLLTSVICYSQYFPVGGYQGGLYGNGGEQTMNTPLDPGCPSTNQFMIGEPYDSPASQPLVMITGGTDYFPSGINGWSNYPSEWWNIWFCNNLLIDSQSDTLTIGLEFDIDTLTSLYDFNVEFSICWTTLLWDTSGKFWPPIADSLGSFTESQVIMRETIFSTDSLSDLGHINLSINIPAECPGWVSIGVKGFNFQISNGVIFHECQYDPIGQCCYFDTLGNIDCVDITESECNSFGGYWNDGLTCNDDCLIPAPWSEPINTGINHTILFPTNVNITIDGNPVSVGDAIGVFFDDGGTLGCGGSMIWQGSQTALVAWGDDPVTTNKDGFSNGEEFFWKIWDASEAVEYTAIATYDSTYYNQGDYVDNGLSLVLSLTTYSCHSISLQGWDLVSTYIDPFNPDMVDVTNVLIPGNLIILKNEVGHVYFPALGLNMIGNWTIAEAFLMKVTNNDTLEICGQIINPITTLVNLPAGWSYFGYLCQWPKPIVLMMNTVAIDIVLVKDESGNVYWVSFGLDMIGDMESGEGYQVKMWNSNSFYYQCGTSGIKSNMSNPVPGYFMSLESTGNNMTLGIILNEIDYDIGDEIGIFSESGLLVGSSVISGDFAAVSIWGNDEYSNVIDGLQKDEDFTIILWNSLLNSESELVVESWEQGDEAYDNDKISITGKTHIIEINSFKLYQNIPNPFSLKTEFSFYLPHNTFVEFTIVNILGEVIDVLISEEMKSGHHKIDYYTQKLSEGSYFYSLETREFSDTRKMVIVR